MKKKVLFFFIFSFMFCVISLQGTWTEQFRVSGYYFNSVCFFDANKGWAVGNNGRTVRTTNGGSDWLSTTVSGNYSLYGLDIANILGFFLV